MNQTASELLELGTLERYELRPETWSASVRVGTSLAKFRAHRGISINCWWDGRHFYGYGKTPRAALADLIARSAELHAAAPRALELGQILDGIKGTNHGA